MLLLLPFLFLPPLLLPFLILLLLLLLRWEETERRRLHNIIQELKGNIRVFCRYG